MDGRSSYRLVVRDVWGPRWPGSVDRGESGLGFVVADGHWSPYGYALTSPVSPSSIPAFSVVPISPTGSGGPYEAPIPAQRTQACQEARVSLADEHSWGSSCCTSSPPEGSGPFVGMIARLSDRRAFRRLHAEGTRTGRGPLRLVVRRDPDIPPRYAFAIPRSVGNAVVRNRTKRRIRAVLHDIECSSPREIPGGDHLVRVTAPLDHWSYDKLRTTMTELLVVGSPPREVGR